jgi:clusterin-associated protein 1
LGQEKDLK